MNNKSPAWPGILAALLIGSLLLAFYQVVCEVVEQSAIRNKATALHTEGTWRCNTLRAPGESASCLSQLKAQANDNVLR